MQQPQRKHWYLLAVAALLWIVCLWGIRRPHSSEPAAVDAVAVAAAHPTADDASRRFPRRSPGAAHSSVTMPALRAADLIADVEIDKPRVCPGESFLVSIRGKPENAASALPIAELNYNIDGRFGDAIALSATSPGVQQYTVVASNGVDKVQHRRLSVEVLPGEARECQGRAIVTLAVEPSRHDPNEVVARVIAHNGMDEPLRYRWDFGDGAAHLVEESPGPVATHNYALRDQQRTLSSYLVTVHASDARGRRAEGRATIHVMNNHYLARMFGSRLVLAVYDRFPNPASDAYRVDVTFRSFEPEVVVLEHAKLTERSCLAGRRDQIHELSVSELAVALRLLPGQATQTSLLLPKSRVSDETCAVELELTGDTIPARTGQPMSNSPIKLRPVMSRLSLDLKAAPSAAEGGAPPLARRAVSNPLLAERLHRATQILGSDRITPAQLDELERDGRLAP